VLEVPGEPLAARARTRIGIGDEVAIAALPADDRYALFESVFYEAPVVAQKQRIYLRYVDRDLSRRAPFLDLGCGRGEFLRILRGDGVPAAGVDINARNVAALRAEAFDVAQDDLVTFLEADPRRFSGAALLQVAEHLPRARLERALELLAAKLLPGGVLIVETPNPLSPFALGAFHGDPTHVAPIPPEALRYFVEAAGFERSSTLFQARVASDQLVGPDARCYYGDYAIIAYRSAA
jgi:O-antigen chain-terminating methyltransferase